MIRASTAKTSSTIRLALGGNLAIVAAKFGAWHLSGSSAMLSEAIHSVVDCGNQALLLVGMHKGIGAADSRHPYGYGKSIYFWALVSALGTFWLGAGISLRHSVEELLDPSLHAITWHVWAVLAFSLAVDGSVFGKVLNDLAKTKPPTKTLLEHIRTIRDPATLAILYEDGAAVAGILLASAGIAASHALGSPVPDGLAGVGISALLAAMGLQLARLNQKFLLGSAVDPETTAGIQQILLRRRSIDNVHSVQSQWMGPYAFSYKAEVDFDGTYLAARLMGRYKKEFRKAANGDSLDKDLSVLLSWYAEDVMRTVEREVRDIELEIRASYPGAAYIELEPDSKDSDRFAIDDGGEAKLRRIEMEVLERMVKSMKGDNMGMAEDGNNFVTYDEMVRRQKLDDKKGGE